LECPLASGGWIGEPTQGTQPGDDAKPAALRRLVQLANEIFRFGRACGAQVTV
jgi:hypothetical protein